MRRGSETGNEGAKAGSRRAVGAILLAAALLPLLICGGLLAYGSGRGFDLTDETFYLVWTRDPQAHALVYQPFGYLLHPLFALVGGDLKAYRLAGFAIAAAAGALLGASLAPQPRTRLAFSLYGAGAALTIFFPWIVTPSYNSAANVGALLIAGTILNAFADRAKVRALGAAAGGAGLCLAAFAKPPLFAIALVAMAGAALVARQRRPALALLGALAFGAILISLLLPPVELIALVRRMSASQHVLDLPNTPLRLPAKVVGDWGALPFSLSAAALAAAGGLVLRRLRWSSWLGLAAIALALAYAVDVARDVGDGDIPDFLGFFIAVAVAGYAGTIRGRWPEKSIAAVVLLLAAPLAVALGTFNNQWFQLNFSLAFPLIALFVLASIDPVRWRSHAARAAAAVAPPAVMLLAAFHPYSLPASIFDQEVPMAPPLAGGTLRVDRETATFLVAARGRAAGALLVDLSGTGPGVAAALGARSPVLAWLGPATPTWPDVVWSRLDGTARRRAWFVAPVWPLFARSQPAQWLAAHRAFYCGTPLPPMTFWGEERALALWRPCRPFS